MARCCRTLLKRPTCSSTPTHVHVVPTTALLTKSTGVGVGLCVSVCRWAKQLANSLCFSVCPPLPPLPFPSPPVCAVWLTKTAPTNDRDWKGRYKLLEQRHGYIQWLFPIHEVCTKNFDPLWLLWLLWLLCPPSRPTHAQHLLGSHCSHDIPQQGMNHLACILHKPELEQMKADPLIRLRFGLGCVCVCLCVRVNVHVSPSSSSCCWVKTGSTCLVFWFSALLLFCRCLPHGCSALAIPPPCHSSLSLQPCFWTFLC